ncbi:hypothetical protein IW261DRAFT_1428937 [Armillaria novae-zelandiae]|uniref:Uncharacterized protein n=1 Tax=Armillaria novae-zelandiae TaxID=153914 RepID=A0AA39N6U5_9AGAR|nr:hypothetical protein IW261DRAFT_1428937 [Armillaria novae-zelandiae]
MATTICPTVQQFDHGGTEIQGGLGIRMWKEQVKVQRKGWIQSCRQGLDISYEQACAWTCTKTDSQAFSLLDGWSHAEYSDRSRFDERVEDPDSRYWDRVRMDKDGCIDEASLKVNVDLQ